MGMFTSQFPGDQPEDTYARIMRAIDFAAILWVVSHKGAYGLGGHQRVAIAEIARLSEAHPDPRVRVKFQEAMTKIRTAHLERCLKQS